MSHVFFECIIVCEATSLLFMSKHKTLPITENLKVICEQNRYDTHVS